MSKRSIRRICELNNLLSPDILSATVFAKSQNEAWEIAGIYEEVTGEDLRLRTDEWRKTLHAPVGLYFTFKKKREQNRFLKKLAISFPEVEVIV